MANKLLGKDSERLATDLLLRQKLINGNKQLAEGIFHASRLQEFQVKEILVEEGSEESDIYFILTGNVEVEVNGRKVANRQAGQPIADLRTV